MYFYPSDVTSHFKNNVVASFSPSSRNTKVVKAHKLVLNVYTLNASDEWQWLSYTHFKKVNVIFQSYDCHSPLRELIECPIENTSFIGKIKWCICCQGFLEYSFKKRLSWVFTNYKYKLRIKVISCRKFGRYKNVL